MLRGSVGIDCRRFVNTRDQFNGEVNKIFCPRGANILD